MAHGFTQTGGVWGSLDRRLATDHEVVRVDMPGHGGSADVHADLPHGAALLGAAGGRATYLGYSMGARFCLHLALDQPGLVESLVLISGTAASTTPANGRIGESGMRSWPRSSTRPRRGPMSKPRSAMSRPGSRRFCRDGWTPRCWPASRPRRTGWRNAGAIPDRDWRRVCGWPAPAPGSRGGPTLRTGHAGPDRHRRARRQVHRPRSTDGRRHRRQRHRGGDRRRRALPPPPGASTGGEVRAFLQSHP